MKALVKSRAEPGLWLEDVPEPRIGINDVLIRVHRTGICGTDVHIYKWDAWAAKTIRVPMVIGHEFVGEIVEVGSNVTDFHAGQIVSGEGHVVCGRCRNCLAGRRHLCADTKGVGVDRAGAFAELLALPMSNVWVHPPDIDRDVAAIFDPFGNAVHTALSFPVLGEDVLVTGAGPIGLLALQAARAFGATELTITDVNTQRLALAKRTGATRALKVDETPLEEAGLEADALIECSGRPEALRAGIAALRPAGTAVVVGMGPEEDATVPLALIQNRELWLTGTFRYANTYPTAIALAATGRVDLEAIITGHYGLDDAEVALRAGRDDPGAVKVMVLPGGA